MGDLDEALTLQRIGDDGWAAVADPRYEAINGMYGGWTIAVTLEAVTKSTGRDVKPSAITVNFVDRVEPGSNLTIKCQEVGGSRSVRHWLAELTLTDTDRRVAVATVVLTGRRNTDGLTVPSMPSVPDPESLEELHPPIGPEGDRALLRPVLGFPARRDAQVRSIAWVLETSSRLVDHIQLAFLSDQCPPRPFYWSDGPRPNSTLTMSVYFHATDKELATIGDDYILHEAVGTRGAHSTSGQYVWLWSRRGELLATSEQLAWFR